MSARHVVVDGSNIATEGRSIPSLAQLDEAVREYRREHPDDVVTVVVDATFGHRIEEGERATFEEAVAHNELVSPPAGAIGRGDAFLLRIAEKVGATVLSNDSFQEFHGEHDWLFNNGRLIGGKPVPEVGWVFTPRTPVRGPRSREATRTAKKAAARAKPEDAEQKKVKQAIATATEEVVEPDAAAVKRRRRRTSAPPAEPVNEPLTFIQFVAEHPLGSEVEGEVDSFSSHGAFVAVDGARCYVPLSGLGSPPPRGAREVLKKGERRSFAVQALDPARRGIELALPAFAHVAAAPTEETVEEEIKKGAAAAKAPAKKAPARKTPAKKASAKKASAKKASARKTPADEVAAEEAPAKKAPARKTPVRKASARKATADEVAAEEAPAKKAPARKTPAKKTPAKKAPAKAAAKTPAKKTPAEKATSKAPAEKAPAKKARAKKAPANNAHAV